MLLNFKKELDERIKALYEKIKYASSNEEKKEIDPYVVNGIQSVLNNVEKTYLRDSYEKLGFKVSIKEVEYSDPHDLLYRHGDAEVFKGTKVELRIK